MVWYGVVVFNISVDTLWVIFETIFLANHLSGAKTSLHNQSVGCYQQNKYNYNEVTTQKT